MTTERIDVREAIGRAAAVIALHVSYEASQDLRKANAAVAELIEALDHIGGLTRALRVGGPDPMDLDDLSDALRDATDTAHAALARVVAP